MIKSFKDLGGHLDSLGGKAGSFLKQHVVFLGLIFSIMALGLSGYNTYLLKTTKVVVAGNLPPTVNIAKLTNSEIEKMIKNGAPVLGNPDAKVTLVEFADFQCPFCAKLFKEVITELKQKYINTGQVKFIYMNFAFLGQESQYSAQASKCAQDQGKFWEYHNYLYNNHQGENQGAFSLENLKKFAVNLGLNPAQFNKCLDEKKYEKYVIEDTALGRKFGVKGTPGTFVNDFFINGAQPLPVFTSRIDSALSGK